MTLKKKKKKQKSIIYLTQTSSLKMKENIFSLIALLYGTSYTNVISWKEIT